MEFAHSPLDRNARRNGTHWRLTIHYHKLLHYHITSHLSLTIMPRTLLGSWSFSDSTCFGVNDDEFTTDYNLYGWLTIANGSLALILAPRAYPLSLVLRIPTYVVVLDCSATVPPLHWDGDCGPCNGPLRRDGETDDIESSFANTPIRIGTMAWLCLAIILPTAWPVVRRKGFELFYVLCPFSLLGIHGRGSDTPEKRVRVSAAWLLALGH